MLHVEALHPHRTAAGQRSIVFIQYGDYAAAVDHFEAGGGETYCAQRYSVQIVEGLVATDCHVGVVCVAGPIYDRKLSDGVRAIGSGTVEGPGLLKAIERLAPTDLVLRTPVVEVLRWARRRSVRILPILADSFRPGLRRWWKHRALAGALNDPHIRWVANHNVNAARSLEQIGVHRGKIIPWDWPVKARPEDRPARELRHRGARRLLFVGSQVEAKGLADAIAALQLLRSQGADVSLTSVGPGDVEGFRQQAGRLGISDHVTFAGRVDHDRALELMRQHDVVLVPSRHEYPEGLPMTIYDALVARTPLVVSDHPMFRGKVEHDASALVFRAGDAADLARQVTRLMNDPLLYQQLSANAVEAFRRIECPAKWGEVIARWLGGTDNDEQWLASYALTSGRYA